MASYTLLNEIDMLTKQIYIDLLTLVCNSQDSILGEKTRSALFQRISKLNSFSVQLTSIIDIEVAFAPHNLAEIICQKIIEDIEKFINFDIKEIKKNLKQAFTINEELIRFSAFAKIIFEQGFVKHSESHTEMVLI
jgi:hypothetical protein